MLLFIRQGGFWKSDVRIQITDLISGTLAYIYDSHKCSADAPDYLKILHNKIIRVELYSETYKTYTLENSAIADDYDEDIAQLCFAQAVKFVEHNADSPDPEIQAQIAVLQHLLFRFMNNDTRGYTYTYELKQHYWYPHTYYMLPLVSESYSQQMIYPFLFPLLFFLSVLDGQTK